MNTITKLIYETMNARLPTWYVFIDETLPLLEQLQPSIPDDGSQNFLAYNVPGPARRRMKMKTGKFLVRKLSLSNGVLTDVQIQDLASRINIELFPGSTEIRLDKGDDITENYREELGGRSCMTGDCADYTGLYASNPDRFQQLIMKQENDSARAIVHKLDNGQYLMDRIYSTCEYLKQAMHNYRNAHDWHDRTASGTVSGLEYNDGEIPYMDTLKYFQIIDGLLTISTVSYNSYGTLEQQDGELESGTLCESCRCRTPEDEIICVNDQSLCESCVEYDYSYCEECDEYYLNDNMRNIVDRDIWVCEWCANDSYTRCKDCGDYVSDSVKVVDGYCEHCLPDDHKTPVPCGAETACLWVQRPREGV